MNQNLEIHNFNNKKVAGVVILYNPGTNFIENINSYLSQIEYLFIIDNSENENSLIKEVFEEDRKIKYIFNNQNIGIAQALNLAAEIAHNKKYKYLLTMDQDSKAPENLVASLLDVAENNKDAGIVSPLHSNRFDTHLGKKHDVEQVNTVMTSGNLLSLDAFKNTGPFCEDFFIDYVDIEYCFRLLLNKYKIYRLNSVILEHNEANLSSKQFLNRTFYPHNHKPFRMYYKTRNLLYLRKKYKHQIPELMRVEYDAYLRTVVKIFLFEKQKLLKIKMILKGLSDYFKKKKGVIS